jgi:hypothetical protein
VEFVTQAVFLRMIQDDPFVQDIGLVVFDEFHERTAPQTWPWPLPWKPGRPERICRFW